MQFVCAVCMQAMTHSVDNVPSQQAVELMVVGLVFVEQCWLRLFLGDAASIKNGVNWGIGFAIGDTDNKNCPLKYNALFSRLMGKTSLLLPSRQTILSNGSSCIQ